jgi:hypothetical protein
VVDDGDGDLGGRGEHGPRDQERVTPAPPLTRRRTRPRTEVPPAGPLRVDAAGEPDHELLRRLLDGLR